MDIQLADWQSDFILNPCRFKVAVCGRRSGKTVMDAVTIYLHAIENPGSIIWFVADTHAQAKDLMWAWLVDGMTLDGVRHPAFFPPSLIDSKKTVRQSGLLKIVLKNGTEISVKGSHNTDALLGAGLDLLLLDEYQSQHTDVWYKLRPMLSDRNGKCIITGTPRGYGNHLYDRWYLGEASNPNRDPEWHSVLITTKDAGMIAPSEIEQARKEMSLKQFQQEYEANFNNSGLLIYDAYDAVLNNTTKTISDFHSSFPLSLGMDFNLGIMATTVSVVDNAGYIYVIDEIYGEAKTETLIQTIKRKYPGRTIICYPDSNAKTTGISEAAMLEQAGFQVRLNKRNDDSIKFSNPFVQDRINSVNARFCTASGHRQLFVNSKTAPRVHKCLTQQGYKDNEPDKSAGLDHMNDALGYMVFNLYPIKQERKPGIVRVM